MLSSGVSRSYASSTLMLRLSFTSGTRGHGPLSQTPAPISLPAAVDILLPGAAEAGPGKMPVVAIPYVNPGTGAIYGTP